MGEQRKIEDEREARACLAAVARAGTRIGPWARARGIDGRSLHAWHMNLSRRAQPVERRMAIATKAVGAATAGLVELVPSAAAQPSGRYVLVVGSISFGFGDDFREETLRRVLGVLRSC